MVKIKIKLKPKEKLLKYLIENKKPITIKKASEAIVVDYKNVYGYVRDLAASGAIIQETVGNATPIQISLSPNPDIYSTEKKRTEDFLEKNLKLKIIKKYVEEINYPFLIVLVFGSYVKHEESKNSDIDICIISDNKEKTNELADKISLLSLKLEIHEFTSKEFVSMISKKEKNLGHEIVKDNIILFGIENYYSLISKWMKKE